ncbi:MAG: gliding motility lipoprotein GldH [Bacteroidales bacterium]|nr:gliding motility lipoprotein GldH [Bacteroidales bacterium]
MTKGTSNLLNVVFFASLMLLMSCNRDIIYSDSMVFPGEIWRLTDIPTFYVPVTDTIYNADVVFTIRTGSDYPFRNLYLFVSVSSPDGKTISDTLQYDVADEKGIWHGKGFGDIHELNLPYKSNVFFPLKGTYQFKIRHGMRTGDLKGVYDFGLRLEKSEGK